MRSQLIIWPFYTSFPSVQQTCMKCPLYTHPVPGAGHLTVNGTDRELKLQQRRKQALLRSDK